LQSNIPGIGIQGGGGYWHSDSPWYNPPSLYTLLYCVEAPQSKGKTYFVNMQEFLKSMDSNDRRKIDHLEGLYPCRSILQAEFTQMKIRDESLLLEMSDIVRKLIQVHPVTQEESLYLNEKWLSCILGLLPEESETLLAKLYEEIEKYTERYIHKWSAGDLLIWDNNIVAHKAESCPLPNRKITQRIIVKSA
jgi:taurine dioxygenase